MITKPGENFENISQSIMDYKKLYEQLLRENTRKQEKILHLEKQQRIFETSFKQLRKLHVDLDEFTCEAEKRNSGIHSFLASFLPEFQNAEAAKYQGRKRPLSLDASSQARPDNQAIPDPKPPSQPQNINEKPALPNISYNWDDISTCRPIGSYRYLTRSNFRRIDELKLCLKFDVCSLNLPTKVQLEIKDNKGNVVFKKRQNIYYVKIQERIPTLDAEKDYRLELTTITGHDESVKKVIIHNKNHEPIPTPIEDESCDIRTKTTEAVIAADPEISLENAIQEFIEEVTFMEAVPIKGQDFVKSIQPQTVESPESFKVKKVSCVVLRRPSTPTPTAALVLQKPLAVPKVRYRWQRGFRKATNGRYLKVPLVKLCVKYSESFELLPNCLQFSNEHQPDRISSMSLNECTCEFQLSESEDHTINIAPVGKDEDWNHVAKIQVQVDRLKASDALNNWIETKPIVIDNSNQNA